MASECLSPRAQRLAAGGPAPAPAPAHERNSQTGAGPVSRVTPFSTPSDMASVWLGTRPELWWAGRAESLSKARQVVTDLCRGQAPSY